MTWLVSLLNPAAWAQTVAAAILAFGLGTGLGYVKGFDGAVAKYQVASLKAEVADLKKAADDKEKILAEDTERAQKLEAEGNALREQIKGILDATLPVPDACKLGRGQLLQLRAIATKIVAR